MHKALIVALDNIGDLVFSSVLLEALAKAHPAVALTVWCKSYAAEIARLLPGAPAVVASDPVWDKAPGRGRGPLVPFVRALSTLRRERFDLALVATKNWRAAAAVRLMGVERRIAYAGKATKFVTDAVARSHEPEPVMDELGRLLAPLDLPRQGLRYRLEHAPLALVKQAIESRFPDNMRQARAASRLVALHPFAGHPRRCWPLAAWLRFGRELHGLGYLPLWIGTADELTRLRAASAAAPYPAAQYADHLIGGSAGSGSLLKTAAVIALASSFVGHDSGPLHIAAGLGVAALGFYLPGEPKRTFPQGAGRAAMLYRSTPQELTVDDALSAFRQLHEAH